MAPAWLVSLLFIIEWSIPSIESAYRVGMPSVETATDFYRNGVPQHPGMVRKMAAVNFYAGWPGPIVGEF